MSEEGPPYAGSPTLCLPAKDPEEIAAGAECLRAFRREILARFALPALSS